MANKNWPNGKAIYMQHVNAALVDCRFQVDSTSATGVSNLKGGLVPAVYMHSGSPSASNPNPAVGYAIVQLGDNFNGLYGVDSFITSPNSGASLLVASAGLTVGLVYTITILGTTTTAAWHTLGVPAGITPAVGVPFVAQATSALGTGAVQVPAAAGSGVSKLELVGNPNNALASSNPSQGSSGYYPYLIFRFMSPGIPVFSGSALGNHTHSLNLKNAAVADGATTRVNAGTNLLGANTGSDIVIAGAGASGGIANASAGTPAGTITAPALTIATPADGSVIRIGMLLSNSSVQVGGW